MEEVFLSILCGDEAEAAICDHFLDCPSHLGSSISFSDEKQTLRVRSRRKDDHERNTPR
jgi:hypothetical protein